MTMANELTTGREGDKPFQEPARKSWLSLNDDSEPVGGDFMRERPHQDAPKKFSPKICLFRGLCTK